MVDFLFINRFPSFLSESEVSVAQSCLTLCDPVDYSPPGSSVHGILQAPLSMEFSRQEYWNGLLSPSPADLSDLDIEPGSPAFQADSLPGRCPVKEHSNLVVRVRLGSTIQVCFHILEVVCVLP